MLSSWNNEDDNINIQMVLDLHELFFIPGFIDSYGICNIFYRLSKEL